MHGLLHRLQAQLPALPHLGPTPTALPTVLLDPFVANTPWWVRLALVCAVIAGIALGVAEWPKRLIKQRAPKLWNGDTGKAAKVGLLGVFLLPTGGILGALLFPAAAVTENQMLALGLGAGCAMFAAPLYDAGTMLIGLLPKVAAKQAGVGSTTSSNPPVEPPPTPPQAG